MKVEIYPFTVGEKTVSEVTVSPILFKAQVEMEEKASSAKDLSRRRMKSSIRFDGSPITDEQISLLSPRVGMKLRKAVSDIMGSGSEGAGEILTPDADGIDKPILYRFGTPLTMKSSNKGTVEIKEVEIQIRSYADLEDVVSQPTLPRMLIELLAKVAAPVGGGVALKVIPQVALDSLQTADATYLIDNVLMDFLLVGDD